MTASPFMKPEEATAAEAIASITDDLSVAAEFGEGEWPIPQYIMDQKRKLPAFPPEWRTSENKVDGCQAEVWMVCRVADGVMDIAAETNTALVSGLAALVLRVFSGRTLEEVQSVDDGFLVSSGLVGALTTNRGNGIAAMVREIHRCAAADSAVA